MKDPLTSVKNILTNNWNTVNTDNILPNIDFIFNFKRVDLNNKSSVLLYSPTPYDSEFPSIGNTVEKFTAPVTIDMRTIVSRDHAIKIVTEVERIINGNIVNPDSNFQEWIWTTTNDLSDKSIKLFRFVMETQLTIHAQTRTI